jgi:hypothetical protein
LTLLSQIEARSKEISTDNYSMSVGELLTMYRDEELNLHPEFQRLFRWTPEQKSRLIESLLLGIPIPSIFVSQLPNGKWEVVDGLQRLSTLFQLAGELRARDGGKLAALTLTKTKYLPGLEGLQWAADTEELTLPDEAKLRIKRSRVDVNIVLSTSDTSAKYELFQRLNTGGSQATDQEVRNAILNMVNGDFFTWISGLAKDPNFRSCIPLTDRALEEQYDLELVTRFLVFRSLADEETRGIEELGIFLTDRIVDMAENTSFDRGEATRAFVRTFEVLVRVLGEDSFRKYDVQKQKASGAMLISLFEVIAVGIGTNAGNPEYVITDEHVVDVHRSVPADPRYMSSAGSGIRASTRIPNLIALGRERFAP